MAFCNYCGSPLDDGDAFCAGCGKPVVAENNVNSNMDADQGASYAVQPMMNAPIKKPAEPKKRRKGVIIGIIAAGAVLLVAAVLLIIGFNRRSHSSNSYAFYLKDYEYRLVDLSNNYTYNSFSSELEGYYGNLSLNINDSGTIITYSTPEDDESYTLYQFDLQKRTNELVARNVRYYYVSKDGKSICYVTNNGALYHWSSEKDKKEKITSDVQYLYMTHDHKFIYYVDNDSTLYVKKDGEEAKEIAEDFYYAYEPYDTGGFYFFTYSEDGYALNYCDGSENSLVSDRLADTYAIYANNVPVVCFWAYTDGDYDDRVMRVAFKDKVVEVDSLENIVNVCINPSGTCAYVLADYDNSKERGTLYRIPLDNGNAGNPEEYDKKVYTCLGFLGDNHIVYTKDYSYDEGRYDLYVDKKPVAENVRLTESWFYHNSNYENILSMHEANGKYLICYIDDNNTAYIYDGKNTMTLDEDAGGIEKIMITGDGKVIYLKYDNDEGQYVLCEWKNGNKTIIETNVRNVTMFLFD